MDGVRAEQISTSRLTTHVLESGSPSAPPVDARRGLRDFSDDLHALLMTLTETGRLPEGTAPVLLGWCYPDFAGSGGGTA